jgi:excisionase family DNA binding protein
MSVTVLPNWLTVPQLAEKTGLSEWTIRAEIKAERLRARRIRRLVRVLDSDAAAWMLGDES